MKFTDLGDKGPQFKLQGLAEDWDSIPNQYKNDIEAILKDQRLGEGVNHPALQGWDLMSVQEKRDALVAAGLAHHASDTPMTSIKLDDFLHAAKLKAQNQEDELGMGAAGRRELQRQADELAEMKRVTLRNERLHDEEVAFQRAETIQQRKDEMKKIADKYEHDLKVINTEHSNNMQAIRTGNEHEIKKMNMEYQHEKDMWDKNNPQEKPESEEPEYVKPQQSGNKFDQDTGEPIKPSNSPQSNQWHTSQQLNAPTKPTKPGNKDDDVTDVEPKPNKPLTLGNGVKKESAYVSRAVDSKGRTQQQWIKAIKAKFPDAKIIQSKMIDGPMQATLPDGRKFGWSKVEQNVAEEFVDEASLAQMRDYFAGKMSLTDEPTKSKPGELARMRDHFSKEKPMSTGGTAPNRITDKMPPDIVMILHAVNKGTAITKAQFSRLQAYKMYGESVEGIAEASLRVDSLVTDALKIMQGSDVNAAVAALKTVLGNREYNSRRGFYNFYVKQIIEMSGQQGVAEGFNGEYDDEAGMAKSNLHTMARAVNGLLDTIGDNENLPEWAQEKIAKAEMMVTGVWDYLISQEEQGIDPKVDEAGANPYAIGMSQAMKSTGDKPPLKKSTINKAHAIARAIEKDK